MTFAPSFASAMRPVFDDAQAPAGGGGGAYPHLKTNLKAWWTLDESSGTRVDSHGSFNLTDVNTVTSAAGKQGSAASFDGSVPERLTVSSTGLQVGGTAYTVAFWVYLTAAPPVFGGYMANLRDPSSGGEEFQILQWPGPGSIRFGHRQGGSTWRYVDSGITPTLSTWYFVCARYDKTGGNTYIDINGTKYGPTSASDAVSQANTFALGGIAATTDTRDSITGRIDECAIWHAALSDSDVADLYNSGSGLTYSDL